MTRRCISATGTRNHPARSLAEESLVGLLNIEFYRGVSLDGLNATPLATWDNGTPP